MSAIIIVTGIVHQIYDGEVILDEQPHGHFWHCYGISESVQVGQSIKVSGLFELDVSLLEGMMITDLIIRQSKVIFEEDTNEQ